MNVQEALKKLKEPEKKRKFAQTVDLIINLKGVDMKRDQVNVVVTLPHKVKDKKVCGFLTEKSKLLNTITEPEFAKFAEKSVVKKLVKDYDYFIAVGKLMPKVATNFGKVLGPVGKMPSPQLGIIMQENDAEIQKTLDKIATSLKIRLKEASVKVPIGKEEMDDEKIAENIKAVYNAIESALPKKKENIRNVIVKLTMGKPLRVDM
jgi:large subunit ribosomal protein L1